MAKKYWKTTSGRRTLLLLMIPAVVLLNYMTGIIATFMKVPFFLDTWGTMLGVMAGGLLVGLIGGVLYNLIMAFTVWGATAWVWLFSNVWIAIITFILWKKKMIDILQPGNLFLAGIIIGLTNAMVTIIIKFVAFGGIPTYAGTEPTYAAIFQATGNKVLSVFGEHLITEFADKIISIFIAAIVIQAVAKKFILTKQ